MRKNKPFKLPLIPKNHLIQLLLLILFVVYGCVSCNKTPEEMISLGFSQNSKGDLIHKASQAVFPREFTHFIRNDRSLYFFNKEATDIGVGYIFKHGPGKVSIYVYPSPAKVNQAILTSEYERCKQEVYTYRYVDTLLTEQTKLYECSEKPLSALFAAFILKAEGQICSMVTVTGKNSWFILFRVSFPLRGDSQEIRNMMSRLPEEFDYSAIQ